MRTPTLLDQLSQAAREDQEAMNRLDERWDRLAAGQLSEAEHDELRGLADATGEGYEAYQAFKPLGPAFQQNVAAQILAQQQRERDDAAQAAAAALAASIQGDPLPQQQVPERRGIFKWAGALAASIALVGAVLLVQPERGLDRPGRFYLSGSRMTDSRGGEPEKPAETPTGTPPRLVFGGTFTLKPGELPESGLIEKLYLQQGKKLVELTLDWKKDHTLDIPTYMPLEAGPAKLVYLIYRPGHEPTTEELLEEIGHRDARRQWQVELRDVELARF